ncbi:hypothetical protein LTR95_019436, partial [Oleoguttula sp. CCFEE 5521]
IPVPRPSHGRAVPGVDEDRWTANVQQARTASRQHSHGDWSIPDRHLRLLSSESLRWHQVHPHLHTNRYGRPKPIPRHCIHHRRRYLHRPWCSVHCNAPDQAT